MLIVCRLIQAYIIILFARIIISWFPINPGGGMSTVYGFLYSLTEPVLGPIRRIIPPIGMGGMGLDVRGVMAVGPAGPPEEARPGFRRLVALADQLGLRERSMGMTDDLEVAVQEGTTMVRVGRALFGPRPGRADLRR